MLEVLLAAFCLSILLTIFLLIDTWRQWYTGMGIIDSAAEIVARAFVDGSVDDTDATE